MKKYLLSFAFVLILGASSYVIGGAASYNPPACSGTWCIVYLPQGSDVFCCPPGTTCPNPNGYSTACIGGSGGSG